MSDEESVQNGTQPSEPEDTRPQRQRDCDALIAALAGFGMLASYDHLNTEHLGTPMLLAALVQTLVDKGLITDDEVQSRKWELMHQLLAGLLVSVEAKAARAKEEQAEARKKLFLARPDQVRGLARSRND